MSHTPGPWTWDGDFPIRIIDAQGYVVCGDIMPSGEANARLIAAAPDLLDALKAMHEAFKWTSHNPAEDDANDMAKAAIAKAEGES